LSGPGFLVGRMAENTGRVGEKKIPALLTTYPDLFAVSG
jgi:hypothetical protein